MLLAVLDLNFEPLIRHSAMNLFAGVIDAHGKAGVCAVMEHLPLTTFRRCVARYGGDHKVKRFTCVDQYLVDGLCAIELSRESQRYRGVSWRAVLQALSLGLSQQHGGAHTLANANATRDWRIYCAFAQRLIAMARRLYVNEPFEVDLKDTVYALDATAIDLCCQCSRGPRFVRPKRLSSCIRSWT
jgi:hypothetical protein